MDGSLTNAGEKLALNLLFRNSGTPPTNVYLGLATNASLDKTVTLTDIAEVDDAGCARQEVVFTAPQLVDGSQLIENNAQQEFGPWSEDEDVGVNYAFLCTSASGTTGDVLATYKIATTKMPAAGESLVVTAGNCGVSLE